MYRNAYEDMFYGYLSKLLPRVPPPPTLTNPNGHLSGCGILSCDSVVSNLSLCTVIPATCGKGKADGSGITAF